MRRTQEKRSEPLTVRLPFSTSRQLSLLAKAHEKSRTDVLIQLIDSARKRFKAPRNLDLELANEMLTPQGETADKGAVKRVEAEAQAEARAEAAERFRKGRL